MLKVIRKHTQAWLIKIIIGAIVIVFIFWGIGTMRSRRANTVAVVNKGVITRTDYQKAYSRALQKYQQLYGAAFSDDLLKELNLEKVVLDGLIRDILVQEGAAELGIRVSDQEIKDYIQGMPVFKEGGQFGQERYRRILEGARLTPAVFEEGLRKELLIAKVSETLGRLAKVSDDEVWSVFQYANRKINLAYVSFPGPAFRDRVKVEGAAVRRYFTDHQEDYRVPARVRVRLARFWHRDYQDKISVPTEEVESYYKSNTEEFREPEKRRLSHVFWVIKPSMSDEEIAKLQTKAEEVLKKAREGGDFERLAQQFSQDPSALEGGDLGYVHRGIVDPSLGEVLFSMKKGEVSGVVKSGAGLHIFKVTDIIPSAIRPLRAVREAIREKLAEKKTREATRAAAAKTYEQIIRAGGLERYAKAQRLSVIETGFFSEVEGVEAVGRAPNFNRATLALKRGELSSLIELPQGYAICEVIDRKESFVPQFDEVETKVRADWMENEAQRLAEARANEFVAGLKSGEQFSYLLRKYGLSSQETGYINPTAPSGSGFLFAESARELSLLTPAHSYLQHPVRAGNVFYVVSLAGVREAPKDIYGAQGKIIRQRLTLMQKEAVLREWLQGLQEKAKIEYGEEFGKYR